jgi:hypothetical protein
MIQCVFFFCWAVSAIPTPIVPDGAGGFVPYTNSRVMPDGSLRPYSPELDGVAPEAAFIEPMPTYLSPE